jgi:hypothetical protein
MREPCRRKSPVVHANKMPMAITRPAKVRGECGGFGGFGDGRCSQYRRGRRVNYYNKYTAAVALSLSGNIPMITSRRNSRDNRRRWRGQIFCPGNELLTRQTLMGAESRKNPHSLVSLFRFIGDPRHASSLFSSFVVTPVATETFPDPPSRVVDSLCPLHFPCALFSVKLYPPQTSPSPLSSSRPNHHHPQ